MCQSSKNISRNRAITNVALHCDLSLRETRRNGEDRGSKGELPDRQMANKSRGRHERLFELSSRVGQAQQVDRRRSRDAAIKTSRFNATRYAREPLVDVNAELDRSVSPFCVNSRTSANCTDDGRIDVARMVFGHRVRPSRMFQGQLTFLFLAVIIVEVN